MHLFTLVQLTCLSLLWVVMATAAALAFPFMLLLTIPVRMLLLPRLFTWRELQSVSPTLFYTLESNRREYTPVSHLVHTDAILTPLKTNYNLLTTSY